MEQSQIKECLDIIINAERDLAQAKEDYKLTVTSAFETYELDGDQVAAIKTVAKAMLKDKVASVEDAANTLLATIEVVKK